jgi:hypothetical protein
MPRLVSLKKFTLGVLRPLSEAHAIDPFVIKAYGKNSIIRIIWTMESRVLQYLAILSQRSTRNTIRRSRPQHAFSERGAPIEDTAVTSCQCKLLTRGLQSVEGVTGDIVEVGSFRGVTTTSLAAITSKIVYAVDPYIGYGGSEQDYQIFLERTKVTKNIRHVRKPSGQAAKLFENNSLSLV